MSGLFAAAVFLLACGEPYAQSPMPVDGAAERIVSLSPHLTELTFAAGAGQRLVGVVHYSDYPADAADIPRIGDAFRIDYEAISLLDPDLVLAWRGGTSRETIERLQSLGYRVVELDAGRLEDISEQLLVIGRLAGTEPAAQVAATELESEIRTLRTRNSNKLPVSVFFQISSEPLFSITGKHVISDIIELCGGRNVFAALSGVAPSVDAEAVVAANPDIIIATGKRGDSAWMDRWRRLTKLTAVQRGHLYTVDRDLISRSGPRIIDGAAEICAALDNARADTIQDSASGG
jgi:iron complex transport system substrate-binding protein